MKVLELLEGVAWKRQGGKITRKYRCTFGPRKGRVMSSPAACNAPYKNKAAQTLKRTKAAAGKRMSFQSTKTKKMNPVSKRAKRLNRRRSAR